MAAGKERHSAGAQGSQVLGRLRTLLLLPVALCAGLLLGMASPWRLDMITGSRGPPPVYTGPFSAPANCSGSSHDLLEQRSRVLEGCGQICDTRTAGEGLEGKWWRELRKRVDCQALFANTHSDAPAVHWPPPADVPCMLWSDYTLDGQAKVFKQFEAQRYSGGAAEVPVWTKGLVDGMVEEARKGKLEGTYGNEVTMGVRDFLVKHAERFRGKHIHVVGSQYPWVEALLLLVGAARVTTIEYGTIRSEHPQVETMTPATLRERFLATRGAEPRFDGGVTFSSLEHSGLGRYGDSLNPWGDFQAMAKSWCVTQAGGPMVVGVESAREDGLFFNVHRVYGPKRWPHFMANWHQVDSWSQDEGKSPLTRGVADTYQPAILFDRLDALP